VIYYRLNGVDYGRASTSIEVPGAGPILALYSIDGMVYAERVSEDGKDRNIFKIADNKAVLMYSLPADQAREIYADEFADLNQSVAIE
jgi:hypothetical protein